ncbi:hypothetical protein LUZ60_014219 [Juncus effusus]|nr:hypothetical protein LUZ60_014219 [Juncus effusus]
MERGEQKPLLREISTYCTSLEEGNSTQSEQKPFDWRAPSILLGFEFFQTIAYAGISLNLVIYLGTVLHGSPASNAANVDTWNGTTFLAPVLGAFLADTYLGKYSTIFISLILYIIGMLTITASAIIPSLRPATCTATQCPPATSFQYFIFFLALYLVAIGTGGVESALMPFGADQYNDRNPVEIAKKQSFFSLYFISMNLGVLVAGTVIVWIEQNIAWYIGFSFSSCCLLIAALVFWIGTPIYRVQIPTGSPLTSVARVFILAFRNRNLEMPKDSELFYQGEDEWAGSKCQHKLITQTDGLRWLDKAGIIIEPYSTTSNPTCQPLLKCTVSQVEEVKILIRMIPIWLTCTFYSASVCQTSTTFIQQGDLMDRNFLSFSIPAASLSSVQCTFMMIFVLIQDHIIIPLAKKYTGNPSGLSKLQRMGIGQFLIILSMASAAMLETFRVSCYKEGKYLSIVHQVPQYVILSCSTVFCGVAQLEFFYEEAPESMRSLSNAFCCLAISLGGYVNSIVVTFIAAITSTGGSMGWLPSDLNKGHLDYYFWIWAGISAVNFVVYIVISRNYTIRKCSRIRLTGG